MNNKIIYCTVECVPLLEALGFKRRSSNLLPDHAICLNLVTGYFHNSMWFKSFHSSNGCNVHTPETLLIYLLGV